MEGKNKYFDIMNKISKSICKIEYNFEEQNKSGTGFLVTLPIPDSNNPIRGLITSNQILNNKVLYNSKISLNFIEKETTIYLTPLAHFCFSDPFLNITFIELKNAEYDGFEFLNIEENENISGYVYIIKDIKEKDISKGKITTKWGFKLIHTISEKDDLLGSPLISLETNKIFGVHTDNHMEDINNNIFSVAVNMKSAIQAIRILYNSYNDNKSAFIEKEYGFVQKELKVLTNTEIFELKDHGLVTSTIPEMFISPQSPFITPLWFYRTNYAWYWTPTEPKNNYVEKSNWIIIYPGCSLKVIGGMFDGFEPAERNINLIHWLESTGFNYLV